MLRRHACRALLEPTVVVGMRRVYHAVWDSTIMIRIRQLRALCVAGVVFVLEVLRHSSCAHPAHSTMI
jgi:hypothetical protein